MNALARCVVILSQYRIIVSIERLRCIANQLQRILLVTISPRDPAPSLLDDRRSVQAVPWLQPLVATCSKKLSCRNPIVRFSFFLA